MATDNKTSILVDELVPEFLDTEGPKFKAFMRAYYEWLETTNQITDRSKNLLKYGDIDTTDDEFIKYFQREVLADFPEEVLANKALLISRIKDMYRSKGSEQAYQMLFRMLYDDEVDFYYPGQDVLRVSDGRWVQETSIRLAAPLVGDLYQIGGRNVVGLTSGATAKVDRVVSTTESGIQVFELFLINIVGVFKDREKVQTTEGDLSGFVLSSIGPLQAVEVTFGGSNHSVGDSVNFISTSGSGANGTILTVGDTSIEPVVIDGGSGYTTSATVIISGGSGTGAVFKVDSIANTETIVTYVDTLSDLYDTAINANTYITSNTGSISANLAIANSSTVLSAALGTSNTTVGTITAMSAVSRGSDYSILPTVTVRQDSVADLLISDGAGGIKGFNATVVANNVGGSLSTVSVDNSGSLYNRTENITIVNTTRTATNARGSGLVSGTINYNGKYIDTRGFISWNNRLQDNYYYQQFAYVLRSKQSVNTYRAIVKKLLHPAGTNVFGDLLIESNAAIQFSANTYIYYSIEFAVADSITSTVDFGTTTLVLNVDPSSIVSTSSVESPQLNMTVDPQSLASTLSIGVHETLHNIDPITITSTAVVPSNAEVLLVGSGTISNFFADDIDDLSADQIAEYDTLTINTLPGNRIFDGIGTAFTTQLANGSTIIFSDAGEEFSLTVSSIDDANTLAVSANVTYSSNGSLVIVSGKPYFYVL